jgi:hypothetical protein
MTLKGGITSLELNDTKILMQFQYNNQFKKPEFSKKYLNSENSGLSLTKLVKFIFI